MGFYTTDERSAVLESCQGNLVPPSKNRVWNFFVTSGTRAGVFALQPVEPHQEKWPTPTNSVSGVHYYGYRYYSAETGRWVSRDLAGELGGKNLYNFANNTPVGRADYLGLMSDYGLAFKLALHWFFGDGSTFTQGAEVVKRQSGVKSPVRSALLDRAMTICQRVTESHTPESGNIALNMAQIGPVSAQDSFWMLHTLNGATGFDMDGTYDATVSPKCGCKIDFDMLYKFHDTADLHWYAFPDAFMAAINILTWGLVGQNYDIDIWWSDRSRYEDDPGTPPIMMGWPLH
jgi:RHS repeat-associated protein